MRFLSFSLQLVNYCAVLFTLFEIFNACTLPTLYGVKDELTTTFLHVTEKINYAYDIWVLIFRDGYISNIISTVLAERHLNKSVIRLKIFSTSHSHMIFYFDVIKLSVYLPMLQF